MEKWQQGYVLVDLAVGDNDEPLYDAQKVAAQIAAAGIKGVVEARPLFSQGDGTFRPYGYSEIV